MRKFVNLRLWGGRPGTKDVSDPNFKVLRSPFNLLRIFKDGAQRRKTEFMLGPSSDVNLTSDTGWFKDLPYMNIHTSLAQFSKYTSSGVNLTSDPDTTLVIALINKQTPFSEASNFRQSCTCLQINFRT